uniref:Uncharacterized protein n=1 Tax=Odontella aurita TaxID=265563 RepID=A0A7S4HJH1_9STRA
MIPTENMMLALAHSPSSESASSSGKCRPGTPSGGRRRERSPSLVRSNFYPASTSTRNPLEIVRTSSSDAKRQFAEAGASSAEMTFLWLLVRERFLSKVKVGEGVAASTTVPVRPRAEGACPPLNGRRAHSHLPPLPQARCEWQ